MKKFIVDIHCHTSMKPYGNSFDSSLQPGPNSINPKEKNSIWWQRPITEKRIKKHQNDLLGIAPFTQSDLPSCLEGNVQVIFNSLYPIERPFVKPWIKVDALIRKISMLSKNRIDAVKESKDYFKDLLAEYKYTISLSGKTITIGGKKSRYQLVSNYSELNNILNKADDIQNIALINTIEGGHSLGTGLGNIKADDNIPELLSRIKKIKSWKHPPFFITLAHHFYNELCGHTPSLGAAKLLVSQKEGLRTGFTKAGMAVLAGLLSTKNGRRILVDVKHMSLESRKFYYQRAGYDNIPIIVSHGCVTGRSEKKKKHSIPGANKFTCKPINFYDNELVTIAKSNGIFGIQMDERRIAKKHLRQAYMVGTGEEQTKRSTKLIWWQIQHIAEVLNANKLNAWDVQSIGSDFDGIIDPINGVFTSAYFKNIEQYLFNHCQQFMNTGRGRKFMDKNKLEPKVIVSKFLRDNAIRFLEKNFK